MVEANEKLKEVCAQMESAVSESANVLSSPNMSDGIIDETDEYGARLGMRALSDDGDALSLIEEGKRLLMLRKKKIGALEIARAHFEAALVIGQHERDNNVIASAMAHI